MCSELNPTNKPERSQILPFSFWLAWEPRKDRECGFMSPRWRSGCHDVFMQRGHGFSLHLEPAQSYFVSRGVKMGSWEGDVVPPHLPTRPWSGSIICAFDVEQNTILNDFPTISCLHRLYLCYEPMLASSLLIPGKLTASFYLLTPEASMKLQRNTFWTFLCYSAWGRNS